MSCRWSNDELEQMAREGDSTERAMAADILEARGEIPEDTYEERTGQTAMEAAR